MIAQILAEHTWWHTYGEQTIWLAAVVAAIGLLSRTRPVRWLWRQLIADPIGRWLEGVTGKVVEEKVGKEFTSNGGESLRDAIDGMTETQHTLHDFADGASERQERIEGKVDGVNSAVLEMSGSVGTTLADHGTRITAVEGRHDEIVASIDRLHECIETRLGESNGQSPPEEA